jgi:hypothetical protein
MSQAEDPRTLSKERAGEVTVEDVRKLMGASTPHFALQLRERIAKLIAGLPEGLGFDGEVRGEPGAPGERTLPSLDDRAAGRL